MKRALVLTSIVAACGGKTAPVDHLPPTTAPASSAAATAPGGPPVAPIREVRETLFGTEVVDPYRWMEAGGDELLSFMKGEAAFTRQKLDVLGGRAKLRDRIHALDVDARVRAFVVEGDGASERTFVDEVPAGGANPILYVREAAGPLRVLVDPATLGTADHHVALDWWSASPDGKLVAIGLSPGGSEESTLHVLDVATGKMLPDEITRTNFASVAWRPDGKSFFYWRRNAPKAGDTPAEYYRDAQVFLHILGQDPESEASVFGAGSSATPGTIPPDDFAFVSTFLGSKWAIGIDGPGVKPESTVYVAPLAAIAPGKTPWKKLWDQSDQIVNFDVHGDDIFVLTHKASSRFEVRHMNLAKGVAADVVVPASDRVITGLSCAADGLWVTQRDGGIARLLFVPYGGKPVEVALPVAGAIGATFARTDHPGYRFALESWVDASQVYLAGKDAKVTNTGIAPPSTVDMHSLVAEEVKVKSADGTMVPLSIIHAKDLQKDGSHPTLINGYGAYGISIDPHYWPASLAWIEAGGVYAVAHVRGGGEYGEDWHVAGQKLTKQHTIDDFLACAQYLVDQSYTSTRLLAGEGTSAGGILIGGAITQRPDLFAAALLRVADTNISRSETTESGPANIPEFGTFKTEDGFKGLFAMDAYLHVKDGTAYPAVLLTTGTQDPRVATWVPAKMAARLQKASSSGKPVLLRVDFDAGHGLGSTITQQEDDIADEWSFLLWQFGVPDFQPKN